MPQISCFVVNLASAHERRAAMEALLSRHGIEPTWFDAVDGRILSDDSLARVFDAARAQVAYGPMSRGEIGTSLSHLEIFRKMDEQGIPCAVILEDDVLLAEDFRSLLDTGGPNSLAKVFASQEPVMVQLTHVARGYRTGAITLGSRQIVRPHGGVWLTSGYFLTLAAARNLLRAMYPVWMVADHWRYFEREGLLRLYALTPNAVWESYLSQASDIAPERRARRKDKKTFVDRLRRVVDTTLVRPLLVRDLPHFRG
ncbi:MAG: glycosyltransferase family 25 protein [Burkholderiaceae bacterium]|nr:glycosyltransferase family 25 protein [Burkholderiaceae bacterium]